MMLIVQCMSVMSSLVKGLQPVFLFFYFVRMITHKAFKTK